MTTETLTAPDLSLVISSDEELSDRARDELSAQVAAASGARYIVLSKSIHAAARQPDGTWRRICHHHPNPDADDGSDIHTEDQP